MLKKIVGLTLAISISLCGSLGLKINKSKAAVDAALLFDQATVSTTVGQTFDLIARVNPGTNQVGAVSLSVTFDPVSLRLDSITRSGAFNTTLSGPTINNTAGTGVIDVGLLTNPATYIEVTSDVATFSFTALATATDSAVSFASSSDASAMGSFVVATRTGSAVTVSSSGGDTTDPVVTAFDVPATSTTLAVTINTFTATDNVGVVGYKITETDVAPVAESSGWSGTAPTSYTFSSEGAKTLYAWARDADGNVSASMSDTVTVASAPTVTAFAIPTTSTSQTVSITTFTAADNVGVTGYLLTETSDTPDVGDPNWSVSAPANYTFSSDGTKTLYAWAKDAAGNVSSSLNDSVNIDSVDPTVTAFEIPATAVSLVVPVTTFTASDSVGVTGYLLTETSSTPSIGVAGWSATAQDEYIFSSAGTKTLYAWAKDAAGNVSSSLNDSVTITLPDTTPPTLSAGSPSGELSSGTQSVEISLTTNENATCRYSTENVIYSLMSNNFSNTGGTSHVTSVSGLTDGNTYTYYIKCIDGSGNANANAYSISFSIKTEEEVIPVGEEIEISKPKVDLGEEDKKLTKDKKVYLKKKKVFFKGKSEEIKNGKVQIYVDGDMEEEVDVDNEGIWKEKVKFDKSKTYDVKFKYLNQSGSLVDQSSKYKVKIDTKDPEIETMPLVLNKRAGDKIWWNATDDNEVRYYKYYFDGKKVKTQDNFFFIPSGISRGMHPLLIRAYDKAGNKVDKMIMVRVR